jgi:3-deoxy-manno-octulosonate cytidylyltransferase (CMP-KDO synthetase)
VEAVVIIPARYASTRLPGKPILEAAREATGKYLIQHVYERAAAAPSVTQVIVATDDDRIACAVRGFGGEVRMTSPDHESGTDRIAEAASDVGAPVVVNVQGDEPEIRPEQIEQVIRLLADDDTAVIGTLAHPIATEQEWRDPNVVKVVTDADGCALYFSRSPIPYTRDADGWAAHGPLNPLRHMGIYSYRREFLTRYAAMPPAPLELAERLEQLRALSGGYRIKVGLTPFFCLGIDTPEDLEAWLARHRISGA